MRTGRSLTVCWSLLPGGVWSRWEGGMVLGGMVRGVSGPGGVSGQGGLVQGVWSGEGGISQYALRQIPLSPVDRQTPVKILPWPNFVEAGKNQV